MKEQQTSLDLSDSQSLWHQLELNKSVKVGYELTLAEPHADYNNEFRSLLASAAKTIRVEVSLASPLQVKHFFDKNKTFKDAERQLLPTHYMLCDYSLFVNNKHLYSLNTYYNTLARHSLNWSLATPELTIQRISKDHSLIGLMIKEAYRLAKKELANRLKHEFSMLDNKSLKGLANASDVIAWVNKRKEALKQLELELEGFGVDSISDEDVLGSAKELRFIQNTFPPRPIVENYSLFSVAFESEDPSEMSEVEMSWPKCPESAKEAVLEQFQHLLSLSANWLVQPTEFNFLNDPLQDIVRIPPIRSIP